MCVCVCVYYYLAILRNFFVFYKNHLLAPLGTIVAQLLCVDDHISCSCMSQLCANSYKNEVFVTETKELLDVAMC